MSTHKIHLKYRTPTRYPTIISIVPPGVALIVTFRGLNYRCLEQIISVPKGVRAIEVRLFFSVTSTCCPADAPSPAGVGCGCCNHAGIPANPHDTKYCGPSAAIIYSSGHGTVMSVRQANIGHLLGAKWQMIYLFSQTWLVDQSGNLLGYCLMFGLLSVDFWVPMMPMTLADCC